MVPRRTLVLLTFASVSVGCAVGPDYKKPEVPLADHYLGKTQVEQRPAAAKINLETWWEGFNDPLLTRFVSLAFDQNLDLAQAAARIGQARSGLRMANVALQPSGNLNASAARMRILVKSATHSDCKSDTNYDSKSASHSSPNPPPVTILCITNETSVI